MKWSPQRSVLQAGILLLGSWFADSVAAAGGCDTPVATVVSVQGSVTVDAVDAELNQPICPGEVISVGSLARAAIRLLDTDTVVRLDQNSELAVEPSPRRESLLDLLKGMIHLFSRDPQTLRVMPPYINAAVEGTEFLVRAEPGRSEVIVIEGQVLASNDHGSVLLAAGDAAVAGPGEAPSRRQVVNPLDAVQWAFYYPRIGAERAYDQSTTTAADLLAVGRVDDAYARLRQSLESDPDDAVALALQATVAVARNHVDEAERLANRAVSIDPRSAIAYSAQSLARQARFDLDGAAESARRSVAIDPDSAVAWARLAELESALGELTASQQSAERAVAIDPGLSRTQSVLGFILLARTMIGQAIVAFDRAVAFDQSDPLPRLGLGLARIRRGELENGRRDIEIAASLDPNSSLIRSYLGKAYFEEKRDPLDGEQYALAKKLDPHDPTPWFYDAIRKQTINRPVEALRDLQKSIALNDNRTVYRSRLALDRDLAVRGASLARIYDDLGFDQLAVSEASKSLGHSPSNHSAHRFLSDAYAELPRHEIARVSELLQAQLLQPVNVNPVQPSLSFVDLATVDRIGPAEAGFNEFDALFERNRTQLTTSVAAGSQGTAAGEIVVSGLRDNLSYSAGGSGFETNGFRANNDRENDVYNLFGQWHVSPAVSLQAEYRHRDTTQGDPVFNFDPADFFATDRREVRDEVTRLGARISPSNESTFIVSGIYADLEDNLFFVDDFMGTVFSTDDRTGQSGYQFEIQHILEKERYNIVSGLGTLDTDFSFDTVSLVDGMVDDVFATEVPQEQQNAYVYGTLNMPSNVSWTIGAGYISFQNDQLDVDEFVPKLGVEWDVTERLMLRGAYFETIKRPLVIDQTIEPTEVAGFNQLFDDTNGSKSSRFGIGLDLEASEQVFAGIEISRRDIDFLSGPVIEPRREDVIRAYVNWMISDRWVFTMDLAYEEYENTEPFQFNPDTPLNLDAVLLPISIRYFSPSGFFAQLQGTYLSQDVERGPMASLRSGEESIVLFDAAVGYRLPERRGVVTLEVQNLLDDEFFYQDDSFRSSQVTRPSDFFPERRILLRANLKF